MEKFEINILGCGSAVPTPFHNPASQVINFRDHLYMIDCGEGTQSMMRRMGLKFSRLRHIFISHMHGDHCLGLPGILSTMGLLEVGGHINVYVPRQGLDIMERTIRFFCRDEEPEIHIIPIDGASTLLDTPSLTVRAIPLYHRVEAYGFIFCEKPKSRHINGEMIRYLNVPIRDLPAIREGADWTAPDGTIYPNSRLTSPPDPSRSYAYCSDTVYNPAVAKAVGPVDLLYHEATYTSDLAERAIARGHSTAAQAAAIAKEAGAKALLIGHYSKRYRDTEPLRAEAAEIFPDVTAATEGMTIRL
ncbi:MAG: ribonuclease Z [Paramuribaculum sp.]|nr:ribonuclease Z [Paramuribaculum sp.]